MLSACRRASRLSEAEGTSGGKPFWARKSLMPMTRVASKSGVGGAARAAGADAPPTSASAARAAPANALRILLAGRRSYFVTRNPSNVERRATSEHCRRRRNRRSLRREPEGAASAFRGLRRRLRLYGEPFSKRHRGGGVSVGNGGAARAGGVVRHAEHRTGRAAAGSSSRGA